MSIYENAPGLRSRIEERAERYRDTLASVLGRDPETIDIRQDLRQIIPVERRREIWEQLIEAGLPLSPLYYRAKWRELFDVLFHWKKRIEPKCVEIQAGEETLEQIADASIVFTMDDYRKGLWPREAIAARVRLIIAENAGVPYERVKEDTIIMHLNAG